MGLIRPNRVTLRVNRIFQKVRTYRREAHGKPNEESLGLEIYNTDEDTTSKTRDNLQSIEVSIQQ